MDFAAWVEVIRAEGRRMADTAAGLALDDPVPSCPGWKVRRLVSHMGRVHRMAALLVSEARQEFPSALAEVLPEGWPPDGELIGWLRDGCGRLAAALEAAPADLECVTFREGQPARDFWARRQAHETSIHRVDAELAAGVPVTGFDAEYAADGIDELLTMFILRPGRNPNAPRLMTLAVEASDAGRGWTAVIGQGKAASRRGAGKADCTVTGPASDLYTFLWNRTPAGGLGVEGDPDVLAHWADSASF